MAASAHSTSFLASQFRPQVLSLYRRIFRASRSWDSSPEERSYILEEAARAFRDAEGVKSREEWEAKIEDGERRLTVALHYGIAYPRLHHLSTGALFSGKATAQEAATAAEAAAAASASAVVQAPAIFGNPILGKQGSDPFGDVEDFEPPSVRCQQR